MLEGTRRQARRAPRNVVGMPIWLPGFVGSAGWRALFIQLEKDLRRHDMIGDFVFFRQR